MLQEDRGLEQDLRASLCAFYEALRWGGMELDIQAEQLQSTLRQVEQVGLHTQARSQDASQNASFDILCRQAREALWMAQDLALLWPFASSETSTRRPSL